MWSRGWSIDMPQSAAPATRKDITTFLRHLEEETFLQVPPELLRSQRKSTTSCATSKQIRFCSFPHRHCGARAKPGTQHHTRARLKTSISCETSSNFDTCHEMPRLPRNLHVIATSRSRAIAICEKHGTRHV